MQKSSVSFSKMKLSLNTTSVVARLIFVTNFVSTTLLLVWSTTNIEYVRPSKRQFIDEWLLINYCKIPRQLGNLKLCEVVCEKRVVFSLPSFSLVRMAWGFQIVNFNSTSFALEMLLTIPCQRNTYLWHTNRSWTRLMGTEIIKLQKYHDPNWLLIVILPNHRHIFGPELT